MHIPIYIYKCIRFEAFRSPLSHWDRFGLRWDMIVCVCAVVALAPASSFPLLRNHSHRAKRDIVQHSYKAKYNFDRQINKEVNFLFILIVKKGHETSEFFHICFSLYATNKWRITILAIYMCCWTHRSISADWSQPT